jgi:tetratricopeptide (TPR) repeat protein
MAPPREAYLKAEDLLRKALELDATATRPYILLGMFKLEFRCDPSGAEKDLNRVRELYPRDMFALDAHSYYLVEIGRMDEAIAEKRRVLEHDPLAVITNAEFGLYLWMADRNDEAIQQLQKTLELDPNYAATYTRLGMAYANKQQYGQAVAELKKAIVLDKTPERIMLLADAYYRWGKRQEARAMLNELVRISTHRYTPPQLIAGFYARFGQKETALTWLGRASENDLPDLSGSEFDRLRSDPRFRKLEERFQTAKPCR